MLKISRLADYATVLMAELAVDNNCVATADLATRAHIGLPTTRKVMKQLNEAGLVESIQGASGGYQLAHSADAIRILDIIAAIDGQPAITECAKVDSQCEQVNTCGLRGNWQRINQLVVDALSGVSLADMLQPQAVPLVFHAQKQRRGHDD